ncbi:ABC transporter substrate-binding protein [Acinetobacter sp. MD2]|uniref:MlaC/ttg2D family ABC transporter substrate-binding protein n=1 Tax=Acinetobacter sp. MD2 TaxID=2600066 RepID=UPI002D1F3ED7|nr:ABC transporter substrate-binding protein [Acinetobacter sp. MD2]MEB3768135.1 ABC transporter substrate-binding protein [Acinetobacter sp. MD2]
MNTLMKQTLTASILSTMIASTAMAAPAEAPPAFVKRIADSLISRLKVDHAKLQNNPAAVTAIVQQNLEPNVDAQAFTRIVMGTYASAQSSSPQQRATFERNLRQSLIQNYGTAFAKYSNQSYSIRPYKQTASAFPVVTLDFNNQGQKTPVSFQLTDAGSQWKVRNINVAGIDLGLQFRNQFADTVKRNGGNLDKAIASFKPDANNATK